MRPMLDPERDLKGATPREAGSRPVPSYRAVTTATRS